MQLSKKTNNLLICPGSYFEQVEGKTYHSSCLIKNGKIVLKQRQLYLAKWEQKLGLSRGTKLYFYQYHSFKIALIISTYTFYSQVIRYVTYQFVNLFLFS